MKFTLGQDTALRTVWSVLADPMQKYLCITGPAGVGKTEVIRAIAEDFANKCNALNKLTGDNFNYSLVITATTNKAVDALNSKQFQGHRPITIYSALGIRPYNGKLVRTNKSISNKVMFIIDESSYLDDEMIKIIDSCTDDTCKVIFVGDPYQLAPVGYTHAPVFDLDIDTVNLTEIMRQSKDNPIQALSLALREFVKGGPLPELKTDNKHLFLLKDEDTFIDTLIDSFNQGRKAKFIGFTNQLVINANNIVKAELEISEAMKVGDTLVCNKFLPHRVAPIKTDSEVTIQHIESPTSINGYTGNYVTLTTGLRIFCPEDKTLFTKSNPHPIPETWGDLRAGYACTIHKSQGSTYQDVFINLDELNNLDDATLSRLLYVAVSRASDRVYFMGTL